MNVSFDYYHNLDDVEFYLCNPDGRELFPIVATNRNVTLRFNDLSELTFDYYSTVNRNNGEVFEVEAYDYVQTRRLIFATKIGWFTISEVTEHDNGVVKYKSVTCYSLQAALKDRNIYSEERIYYFYNPDDPFDQNYNDEDEESIPSVVGQLFKQLGIDVNLTIGLNDPSFPCEDWTITYINSSLTRCARTFDDNQHNGYEWIIKEVADAYEICVVFDFYYKTIHFMLPSEVTEKANLILSFNNFTKDIEIEENAENIVTVLDVTGDNCDIRNVNPAGTNYLCNFDYYMDEVGYKWMSSALITKLKAWKAALAAGKTDYQTHVTTLRNQYALLKSYEDDLQYYSLKLTDLKNARDKKITIQTENPNTTINPNTSTLYGIIQAETVDAGKTSLDSHSSYYSTAFTSTTTVTGYSSPPLFNTTTRTWYFSGSGTSGSATTLFNSGKYYFIDVNNSKSYGKLTGKAVVSGNTTTYECKGFDRFAAYDELPDWIDLYEGLVNTKNGNVETVTTQIESTKSWLESHSLNIINYFASTPTLFKELTKYWIEGSYTNDNITVTEDTELADEIDLENELMTCGETELARASQPKISFNLTAIDFTKQEEFIDQIQALELGKIITVEKEEGLWFYPALLEISMSLDDSNTFELKFATGLKLDDWAFTYADLLFDASNTAKEVGANWQNLMAYNNDKQEIGALIRDPLSATLRAAFANMVNQEFTIDSTGILGRKEKSNAPGTYEDEQVRLLNNVIVFTDDNWSTIRTALGKIYYQTTGGQTASSYGLAAETIIGSFILGEKLKIANSNSSVNIDGTGITITNNGTTVFQAKNDGTLTVGGYATEQELASKNSTYYTTWAGRTSLTPVAGDLLVVTDRDNKLYRYNGTTWIEVADTRIDSSADSVQTIYYITDSPFASTPTAPSSWVTGSYSTANNWSITIPDPIPYRPNNNQYGVYYTCVQTMQKDGTIVNGPVTEMNFDNTILEWCATEGQNKTVINGGMIATGSIYANSIAANTITAAKIAAGTITANEIDVSSIQAAVVTAQYIQSLGITTSSIEVKDSSNRTIFSADANNRTVQMANFTVEYDKMYTNGRSTIDNQSYSGVYIGSDGISVQGAYAYGNNFFMLDVANSEFIFNGTLTAGALNPFNIGSDSFSSYNTTKLWMAGRYNTSTFPGIGGIGPSASSSVYIGGEGISLWYPSGSDYCTSLRSGVIQVSAYESSNYKGVYIAYDGIYFPVNTSSPVYSSNGFQYAGFCLQLITDPGRCGVYIDNSSSAYGWLISNNRIISTSDERVKNSIVDIPSSYDTFFDNLRPRIFKFNDTENDKYHTGFIAQEVYSALETSNMTEDDFSGYLHISDVVGGYALRYEDFISLNTMQIQKLKARVAQLEAQIAQLLPPAEAEEIEEPQEAPEEPEEPQEVPEETEEPQETPEE